MEIIPNTPEGVDKAAGMLRTGKLLAWPSPLWWGLSANALDEDAVRRLYAAKRRAAGEPLITLTTDVADARRYGELNPVASTLVDAFWPGYLGVIVRRRPATIPDFVTAGRDTVLLACLPGLGHELPIKAGVPVVASSANVSGTPPALDLDDVLDFVDRAGATVDAVLDGPVSPFNRPTTIVDTTVTPPTITRVGVAHPDSVRKLLPDVTVLSG